MNSMDPIKQRSEVGAEVPASSQPVVTTKPDWAQSRHERANVARVAQGLKPRRRKWPWVVLILLVAGGAGGFLYLSQMMTPPPPPADTGPAEPLAMQVNETEIVTMEPRTLARTVSVSGTVFPLSQVTVAAEVTAPVRSILARPGDMVSEGDVLVELDTRLLEDQLNQQTASAEATRAQLQAAESQLARTEDLISRGLSPSAGIDEARSNAEALRANLTAAETQVASAERALGNATILAPSSGMVSVRAVEPGQTAQPGASLMTIVDLSELELRGNAPIGTSALIAPGQSVSVTVEGLTGQTFTGTVERVNPTTTEGTRTVPVYVHIDNSDGRIRGGAFATGAITIAEEADALAVPLTALREDAEGDYVLVVNGETVERRAVTRGDSWDSGALVAVEGLSAGDVVVSAPLEGLAAGDRIAIVEG